MLTEAMVTFPSQRAISRINWFMSRGCDRLNARTFTHAASACHTAPAAEKPRAVTQHIDTITCTHEHRTMQSHRKGGEPNKQFVPPPPENLAVDEITVGNETFLLFEWDAPQLPSCGLTEAERDVLCGVLAGHTNELIAHHRDTDERTVAKQVSSLLRKLGASSRFELIGRYGRTASR
jgi:DNA-binding NarL/FixJ family response regulator